MNPAKSKQNKSTTQQSESIELPNPRINTTLDKEMYRRFTKMRKDKGLLTDAELSRIFIAEGLAKHGY